MSLFDKDGIIELKNDEAFDFVNNLRGNNGIDIEAMQKFAQMFTDEGLDDPTEDSMFTISMGIDDESDLWGTN